MSCSTSLAEHWYFVPKLYMYNLVEKEEMVLAVYKKLNKWLTPLHTYYMQVPLQTDFGVSLKPKNGIYLKVINRT